MKMHLNDEEFNKNLQEVEKSINSNVFSETFKNYISLREMIFDENDYQLNELWKSFSKFLAENLSDTRNYIENKCTASEFSWLSEIFSDINNICHDSDFIKSLEKTAEKFPEECVKYNILSLIKEITEN